MRRCRRQDNDTTTSGDKERLTTLPPTTVQLKRTLSSVSHNSKHSIVRRCIELEIGTLQSSSENLNSRSKCPWTYSYNTDPNRIPQTLVEAQCSQTYVPHLAGQCEHVIYYVPVKQNISGTWTDQWISLRVGCTLAKPLAGPPRPPITFD